MTNDREPTMAARGSVPADAQAHRGVVVGYDDSPTAAAASEWAAAEAVRRDEDLLLVACSVVPSSVDFYGVGARQEAALEAAATRLHRRFPDLRITVTTTPHDARDALVREAQGAALLVVGASGSHALRSALGASVPRATMRRSSCPVAVVRGTSHDGGPIVVGVDGSAPSRAALEVALARAVATGAALAVVYAGTLVRGSADPTRWLDAARARVDGSRAVATTVVVERQDAYATLMTAASRASVIIVGTRGRAGLSTLISGSTAIALCDNAPCPVIVVPLPGSH